MSLVRQVLERAHEHPSRTALIAGDGTALTYGELRSRVLAVRDGFVREGLQEGDGVLFSVRPSPQALVLALGVVAAGGVVVFADPGAGPEMFEARLRLAAPRWSAAESLLYAASRIAPVRAYARRRGLLLPRLAGLPLKHVYSGRRLPGVPRGARSLDAWAAATPSGAPVREPRPGDPAVVIFTSGTTSAPRAVVHTEESLAAGLDLFRARVPLAPGDVVHTDQLMLGLPTLVAGACWSMPPLGCPPARFRDQLAERRATHTFCVPVHLAEILDAAPGPLPDTLRHVLLGAAPAPAGILRRATAAAPSAEILSVYAMTEIVPVAIASAAEKVAHAESAEGGDLLGELLPGVKARVASDGELLLSGPNLCKGYLGQDDHTELRTGDMARLEGERLILLGRKKDMVIRGKFNIYPGLYEPAVMAIDGVREAAFVGVADAETGDEEVVLVVAGEVEPDELAARLKGVLDAGAWPDRIVRVEELPYGGRGRKLDRNVLRGMVSPGES
ncbi:class I adenylate-forming enzyme family protein [Actinocorallia sp. A-T 12471]|uniref:class I adenylate-forming enzyme family protein n=1 Tax=Actinocorallia sp. A-T 12471 TaxID=3089813 RepID=UPI0029CF1BE0|nr:class I adenylate-forming enzyme family protein [Actinocorallia sp. A-T 12471]MDX6738928.1 class I adenylate-forming enzyme family protein [Actinocorallia sp. A-T 12471]